MISFRLSVEEYERFRDLCFTNGIRNVSEMARNAVSLMLQPPMSLPQESLETRVTGLESRLSVLFLEVKRLRRQLAPTTADGALSLAAAAGLDAATAE
jgi:hypothetical protein